MFGVIDAPNVSSAQLQVLEVFEFRFYLINESVSHYISIIVTFLTSEAAGNRFIN